MDHTELTSTLSHCLSRYRDKLPSITSLQEDFLLGCNSLIVFLKDMEGLEAKTVKDQSVIFDWSYEAKEMAMLYRDILFNHYKSTFLDEVDIDKLYSDQKAILSEATHSTIDSLKSALSNDVQKDNWKHYKSPISLIIEQIETLKSHIEKCTIGHQTLLDAERDITLFNVDVHNKLDGFIDQLKDAETEAIGLQKTLLEDPSKFFTHLSKTEKILKDSLSKAKVSDLYFSKNVNAKIPVSFRSGILEYKDINFKDQINYWIDNEILPEYNPFLATRTNALQKLYLGISNIKGKLQDEMLSDAELEQNKPVIQSLIQKISQKVNQLEESKGKISKKITDHLKIEHVFSNSFYFLVSPSQLQIDYYGKSTKNIVANTKILQVAKDALDTLKIKAKRIIAEDKLSDAIEFIDSVIIHEDSKQSIFIKEGYIGDSFYEHREEIEKTLKQSIVHWKKGFLGSALVSGDYQSGKSSVLGYLQHEFLDEVISIEANKDLFFKGKKENFGYDLEGAIKYIHRQIQHDARVVVSIDDIEKWGNENFPVYQNMQLLSQLLNQYGSKIYFLVSCNTWIKSAADRQMDFSKSFSTNITCSKMDIDDIVNATIKRHLATHHSLEDTELELDEDALVSQVKKHTNNFDRNIGASLRQWFCSSEKKKEVLLKMPRSFVQIIQDHQIIFNHLLKFRTMSEATISRNLGSGTIKSVQQSLPYLIQNKLLKREIDGDLKINPNLLFYVEKAIKKINSNNF